MRIAVLADHPDIGVILRTALEVQGHTVRLFHDAQSLLQKLTERTPSKEERYALLIADELLAGDITRLELLRAIRPLLPHLHLLFLSGSPLDLLKIEELPAQLLVLQKPFQLADLLQAVEQATQKRGRQ